MSAATPIRVIVFTGGPELQPDVLDFVGRLEKEADIQLLGIFCQAGACGLGGVVRDLWARRGFLALPLLLQRWLRIATDAALAPSRAISRRQTVRDVSDRLHFLTDIHDPQVIAQVRALEADLGLVYGGPILRQELYSLPKRGTLGIHHGLTPEYRGKKTTFWAMYNDEDFVGVTMQLISSRLDHGDILAEGKVRVGRAPLPVVTAKLQRLGIDLYVKVILQMRDGTARPIPQSAGSGNLYRDPSATDILRFWWRYFARLLRPKKQS